MQRKVDKLNKKTPQNETRGEAKKDSDQRWFIAKWWAEKDEDSKKLFLYIFAIIIAYAVAHIAPDGKAAIYRGAAALIVVHFIWTFSPGKAGKITWFVVIGMLSYFVLAWVYPNDAPRVLNAGWELSKKGMASFADGAELLASNKGGLPAISNAPTPPTASKDGWYVLNTTATNTAFVTASIPAGVRFSIYCIGGEGIQRVWWRDASGQPQAMDQSCGDEVGEDLHAVQVGVISATPKPINVMVKLTPR